MDKASMMGTFTCQDGKAGQMEKVLTQRSRRPGRSRGVEVYSYHRGDGNDVWFFVLMADEASMQQHGQGEAMRTAMAAFGPLVAEPPQMTMATPVAAIGLDL